MADINAEIGKKIRSFRRARGMTLEELSRMICKSKSTLSKYESGEISIDVQTLYELAEVLEVRVEQLLYCPPGKEIPVKRRESPAFFSGLRQFYAYLFDGRVGKLTRCIFEVLSETECGKHEVMLYMNFQSYESYQNCENTYWGYMEHYDALTSIQLTNRDTPMEKAGVQVLASYLDSDTKWGLWCGLSSRPMMPVAAKMLFSKARQKEDGELLQKLRISREDIRLLKMYNMLAVV